MLKRDLKNKKFGRLTAIEQHMKDRQGNILWKCSCECGSITYVSTYRLNKGRTLSCGCIAYEINKKQGYFLGKGNSKNFKGEVGKRVVVTDIETGEQTTFSNMTKAHKELGGNYSTLKYSVKNNKIYMKKYKIEECDPPLPYMSNAFNNSSSDLSLA